MSKLGGCITAGVCLTCFSTSLAGEVFVESAAESGLDFEHVNGMSGELYFVEMMGQGGALIDYDNDGDLDVYLIQGQALGPDADINVSLTDQLYRNDTRPNGELRFTNVTGEANLRARRYGIAAATGDFDNDGWTDLYLANFGPNQLWRNRGDGTFEDVTEKTGVDDPRWSSGAVFFDYDRDGWLDLFVINYVDFTVGTHRPCYSDAGALEYCGPRSRNGLPDRLYRNRGDGSFEDVTDVARIGSLAGRALGVLSGDFDDDGWPDVYIANDADPNRLWMNQGDGTFVDDALLAGAAVNAEGAPEAGMGVDAGDFDNDGDEDIFVTHLVGETNTLYVNDGSGWFSDQTVQAGLAHGSWPYTGFGTAWLDYDNDGRLDLVIVNGEVRLIGAQIESGDPHPLRQRNQLYRGAADARFVDVTTDAGAVFEAVDVSRGAIAGDLDNDGDIDVLITNNAGPVSLARNVLDTGHEWIGLRLVGPEGRDALGAWVSVTYAGQSAWRRVRTGAGYSSAKDPRLLFGLGRHTGTVDVRVRWPDGDVETWTGVETGAYHVLQSGTGRRQP